MKYSSAHFSLKLILISPVRSLLYKESLRKGLEIFRSMIIGLLFLSLLRCGHQENPFPQLNSVGQTPKLLMESTVSGVLRAQLQVYGPDGDLEYEEALQINSETGEVFSNQFKLPRGFTYSFIVTFYYSAPNLSELPIAVVAKVADAQDSFLAIFWEASEVLTSLAQLDPSLSASLSSSYLPDLDTDDDGYANFTELREGSDPFNVSDLPRAPQLEEVQITNKENFVEFSAVFSDVSGVDEIRPFGKYQCGYYDWKVEALDSQGLRKRLHIKFNLHSQPDGNLQQGDDLTFEFFVTDILGMGEVHPIQVEKIALAEQIPPELNHPEIAVLRPQNAETVSDFFNIEAQACHRYGINEFKLNNIGSFIDEDGSNEGIFGVLQTQNLEKDQVLQFIALASGGGQSNQRVITVVVDDQNPIKIDSPTPGSTLQDGFTLVAHVDKGLMPDVAQLFIERITTTGIPSQDIFDLNPLKFDVNTLPEAFTGQVFDTSAVAATQFKVHFVAIGSKSGEKRREVTYFLNNRPVIEEFDVLGLQGPWACISGENSYVQVQWEVENLSGVDPQVVLDGVEIEGPSVSFASTEQFTEALPECKEQITLEAIRFAQDLSGTNEKIAIHSEPRVLQVTPISIEQQPDVAGTGYYKPQEVIFKSSAEGLLLNSLKFKVEICDLSSGDLPAESFLDEGCIEQNAPEDMNEITGEALGLESWHDYKIRFILLNKQGHAISKSDFYDVRTSHDRIVSWLRFDQASPFQDVGGFSHLLGVAPGDNAPFLQNVGCLHFDCFSFNGINQALMLEDSELLNPVDNLGNPESFTISVWIKWDELGEEEQPIVVKRDQYSLKIMKHEQQNYKIIRFEIIDQIQIPHIVDYNLSELQSGQWYHFSGVYSGSGINKKQYLYVNATRIESNSVPITIQDVAPLVFEENITIGKSFKDPAKFFSGFVDEVLFYDSALSQIQIENSCKILSDENCYEIP